MTPQQATDDINSEYRTQGIPFATGAEIYDSIDPTAESALDPATLDALNRIYSLGNQILVGPDSRVRAELLVMFPPGQTRDALAEAFSTPVSRAAELGLPEIKLGWTEEVWPY